MPAAVRQVLPSASAVPQGMAETDGSLEVHEQLAVAALEVARLACAVDAAQLAGSTPCPGYDVRALAAHLMQELVLHGWDLATATGQTPRFPDDVAEAVLRWLESEDDPMRSDDWYRAPVSTASASPMDRAVARSGRDPGSVPAGQVTGSTES